jgi:hypothetical protein
MVETKISLTPEQAEAVRKETAVLLNEQSFRTSDRCTKLLKYLVEETLHDNGALLKERRAGHEVFGRDPGYDTSADPIVRNVASEIRKRLRQFYSEHPETRAVRIELLPGTYILRFNFGVEELENTGSLPGQIPVGDQKVASPAIEVPTATGRQYRLSQLSFVLLLGFLLIGGIQIWHYSTAHAGPRVAAVPSFWQPVLSSNKEIFISVGHGHHDPIRPKDYSGLRQITMTDLNAYENIGNYLRANNHPFQMQLDNATTMDQLRDRPVVLVGNINNEWVLRLTEKLRYHYVWGPEHEGFQDSVGIEDSQHPGVIQWQLVRGTPHPFDFAIAERFKDSSTGDIIVCVAGAGSVGTQAASELITDPKFLDRLPKELSNPEKNIQIILKTPIVDGISGPPEIITTYVW